MGPITGTAVGTALAPAADPNSVNTPTSAGVASPIYPGAVDPATYAEAGNLTKTQALDTPLPGQEFTGVLPAQAPGGGYQDISWQTGTDAPMAPWDAQQDQGIGPGAIIDTHFADTGAVYQAEHVVPPAIGTLARRAPAGQTQNLEWGFDQATGERVNAPNGRVNLDQYQDADCGAYDPVMVGYAERPIYSNLAAAAAPYSGGGIYSPDGATPDLSPYDYAAIGYTEPPSPAVGAAAAAPSLGGSWVLG